MSEEAKIISAELDRIEKELTEIQTALDGGSSLEPFLPKVNQLEDELRRLRYRTENFR